MRPAVAELPVVDRLRDETRDLHAAVEARVPLLRPTVTGADYRRHLEALLGFHDTAEAYYTRPAGAALGLDLASRRRAALLAQDLAALGASPADVARLPRCALPAGLERPPRLLGLLYVLEGSTLGAQVLLREALLRWLPPSAA